MTTIAIDFDQTLVYEDTDGIKPIPGAAQAMQDLRDQGYKLVIYTCRTGIASRLGELPQELAFIEDCLRKFAIPYDDIFLGEKLVADFYVDDRAINFRGDWHQTLHEIDYRTAKKKAG